MEILRYTHQFLQKFCAGNPGNQALLHKHLHLFLTPGVRAQGGAWQAGQGRGRAGDPSLTNFVLACSCWRQRPCSTSS